MRTGSQQTKRRVMTLWAYWDGRLHSVPGLSWDLVDLGAFVPSLFLRLKSSFNARNLEGESEESRSSNLPMVILGSAMEINWGFDMGVRRMGTKHMIPWRMVLTGFDFSALMRMRPDPSGTAEEAIHNFQGPVSYEIYVEP